MAAYVLAALVLLTCNNAYSLFICSPTKITPTVTTELFLRCTPKIGEGLTFLGLHITKKPNNNDVSTEESHDGSQDKQSDKGNGQESQTNQDEGENSNPVSEELPIYNPLLDKLREKRSTETDFRTASITSRSNDVTIVPESDRFNASGKSESPQSLTVTILQPGASDLGVYECQTICVDGSNVIKIISETIQVLAIEEITLEYLGKRVEMLEKRYDEYSTTAGEMIRLMQEMKFNSKFLETDVVSLKKDTQEMSEKMEELAEKVNDITAKVEAGQGSKQGEHDSSESKPESTELKDPAYIADDFRKFGQVSVNQFLALVKHIMELKKWQMATDEQLTALALKVESGFDKRLSALELCNCQENAESLEKIETETIPLLQKEISDCKNDISALNNQKYGNISGISEEFITTPSTPAENSIAETTPTETTSTTEMTTTEAATETTPLNAPYGACFFCGDNMTEVFCTKETINNLKACPNGHSLCITHIYQNDDNRHIYKGCASEKECKTAITKSNPSCEEDTFESLEPKECHFCCTKDRCNDDMRPTNNDRYVNTV